MVLRLIRRWLERGEASSAVEAHQDQVWMSTAAKFDGLRRALSEESATGAAAVVLVAHFPDVLLRLREIAAEHSGPIRVGAVLARQLSMEHVQAVSVNPSAVVTFLIAERHPLKSVDDELIRFVSALPCRSRVAYHVSLEDPLMQRFGVDSIRSVLDRLGAAEDEPITHKLVTRSIERAQAEFGNRSVGAGEAQSAEEWFERHT